ncbi:hypothetical protein TW81_10145 [Vibrio galatheae]|uniref:J domain-containing protein n=1 Tax=Vibrio galatheae TaxID=579748 RepID=A0A0F4NKH0_9VIBR|nr:SEL1-like repeat protein [Vibrio galatheae]KJY83344.1 hypothetical protein TW81_10145 [Vibrio galatheae]
MRTLFLLLVIFSSMSQAQTVEALIQSAQNNNLHAQFELAEKYAKGQDVEQSDSESFYWYQQAAENGNTSAAAKLGEAYYQGIGTSIDIENAIFWLSKAALAGDQHATLLLGQLYEKTTLQPDNLDLAKLWYQQAAKEDPNAEDDYARVLEQQFNNRRAKQVAAIDQLEVAFDGQNIELSPKARSISESEQAQNAPIYALTALLLISLAVIAWLIRTNRKVLNSSLATDSDVQRQQVKLDRELRRKDETLKQQKRQMEAMYRHIKKLQAQENGVSNSNQTQDKPITLACAMFGFNPAKLPEEKQIKIRYKQLSKIYHPDLKGSEDEMKLLNQALKVILKHVNK